MLKMNRPLAIGAKKKVGSVVKLWYSQHLTVLTPENGNNRLSQQCEFQSIMGNNRERGTGTPNTGITWTGTHEHGFVASF